MRPSYDSTFLAVAEIISRRATCPRARVGAVITINNRIVATGYNGAAPGAAHCDDVGCFLIEAEGDHCQRAIHAETNAIAQAAQLGISTSGGTMYFWGSQGHGAVACIKCTQLMVACGIVRVVDKVGKEGELNLNEN